MPASPPIVIRNPVVKVTPEGGTEVDLSCYMFREARTANGSQIDVGTFCNPGAQANGITTFAATWDFSVTEDLATVFEPLVGEVCEVVVAVDAEATSGIAYTVQPDYNPALFGTWQIGSRVESSMTLGILVPPATVVVVPAAAALEAEPAGRVIGPTPVPDPAEEDQEALELDLGSLTIAEALDAEAAAGVGVLELGTLGPKPPMRVLAAFAWIAARRRDPGLSFEGFLEATTVEDLLAIRLSAAPPDPPGPPGPG